MSNYISCSRCGNWPLVYVYIKIPAILFRCKACGRRWDDEGHIIKCREEFDRHFTPEEECLWQMSQ